MWHFSFDGEPGAIRRRLSDYSATLKGPPKEHFDEVCPVLDAMVGLLKANAPVVLTAAGDGKSISVVLLKSGTIHVQ